MGTEPSAGRPFGLRLFLVFEIEVDVADLAKVRFTTDAVWETTASIHAFVFLRHHLLHQRLRRLVPKQPDFDLDHLLLLARDADWLPDVWAPPPSARPGHPLDQLDALRHTDLAVAEADLEQLRILAPDSAAARMEPQKYLDHTAAALQGWWAAVLEPMWDRVDAIQRADIAHHQSALATGGLAATMPELHRGLSFHGGRLRVDLGEGEVALKSCGQGIWFVPSVFRWPWVALDTRETVPHVVSYGARGAGRVWQQPGRGSTHRTAGPRRALPGTDPRVPRRAALDDHPVAVPGPLAQHRERAPVGAGRRRPAGVTARRAAGPLLANHGRRPARRRRERRPPLRLAT